MIIVILSFLFFVLVFFTEQRLSTDAVLIYIMLLALYLVLSDIKDMLER